MKNFERFFNLVVMVICFSAIVSCSSGLSGKYKGKGAMGFVDIELEFKSNGKVLLKSGAMGESSTQEIDYEKNGDQVKLIVGGQNQILTIDKDGCLDGMGAKLCKAD